MWPKNQFSHFWSFFWFPGFNSCWQHSFLPPSHFHEDHGVRCWFPFFNNPCQIYLAFFPLSRAFVSYELVDLLIGGSKMSSLSPRSYGSRGKPRKAVGLARGLVTMSALCFLHALCALWDHSQLMSERSFCRGEWEEGGSNLKNRNIRWTLIVKDTFVHLSLSRPWHTTFKLEGCFVWMLVCCILQCLQCQVYTKYRFVGWISEASFFKLRRKNERIGTFHGRPRSRCSGHSIYHFSRQRLLCLVGGLWRLSSQRPYDGELCLFVKNFTIFKYSSGI